MLTSRALSSRLLVVAAMSGLCGGIAGCPSTNRPTMPPGAYEETDETADAEAEPAAVPRRAEVGAGQQGRSLDDETGVGRMIAQPAVSLFAVRERAVFEIQIPQAMQLFEAVEGRKPKSHEEFMQRIVSDNQIRLPELPAGSEYRYEPDKGELWVHPQTP